MTPDFKQKGIQLYHGNSIKILAQLSKNAFDAVITDPPYGIAYKDRKGRSLQGDESYLAGQLMVYLIQYLFEVPLAAFASPKKPWHGEFQSLLVWDKGGAVGGGGDCKRTFKQTWELIQVSGVEQLQGKRDVAVHRNTMVPQYFTHHPTQKPIALMEYLIEKLTKPGDTVLDPFMGSGSTALAAINTGRKFIGIEIDEVYYQAAIERIANHTKGNQK